VEVADLRAWERGAITLPDGAVGLVGPNGAGKTSLVEAITLGFLGVSPRTAREIELVRAGATALHVALDVTGPDGEERRELGFAPGRGRRLRRGGEPVRALADWRVRGAVLVFIPDELRAVKGPPAARRRALDRLLEATRPGYAGELASYGEALAQRNALLRRVRAGETGPGPLAAFEDRMAAHGARVAAARRSELAALAEPFARWLAELGGGDGGGLSLEHSPSGLAEVEDAGLAAALAEAWAARRPRDLAAAQTLSGPHRDDVRIGSGDPAAPRDLRRLGSQGEQRTAALAMLLSHRDRLSDLRARPVLLLDDVLSELDPGRRARLLRAVAGPGQAILTSADPAAFAGAGAHEIRVEAGRVVG
jgi:DNA replication and repair protein RecF